MTPNLHENSLLVFYQNVLPKLTKKQEAVLEVIFKMNGGTDEQIADFMEVGINNVSNRVGELIRLKLLTTTKTVNKRHKVVRFSRPNPNYKLEADPRVIKNRNLEKAQEPLSLSKVKYFVEGKQVVGGKLV